MASIKNFLVKISELTKRFFSSIRLIFSKKSQILLILLILILGIYAYYSFYKPSQELKKQFYPIFISKNLEPQLKHVYDLFSTGRYFSTTSYVDDILPALKDDNSKKWALFFQAESYFLLEQNTAAWQKFFALYTLYPNIWQVKLRLAALKLMVGKTKEAGIILKSIHNRSYETYYWMGRYEETLSNLGKALYNYNHADTHLPEVNFRIAMLIKKDDPNIALRYFKKAEVFQYKNYKEVLENTFDIEVINKNIDEMILYAKKMTPYYITDEVLVYKVAKAFYNIGQVQKAEDVFENLTKSKYIQPETARMLVQLNDELKNYDKVIYYSRLFKVKKSDKFYLINAYLQKKDYFHLIREVKDFLENENPNLIQQEQLNGILVYTYTQLGQPLLAIQKQKMVVSLNPSLENLFALATLYSKRGKTYKDLYRETLNRILEKDPKSQDRVIQSIMDSGNEEIAEEFISKALKSNPEDEMALFSKAQLYLKNRDTERVKTTLLTLVHLNIKDKTIAYQSMYSLGSILLTQEEYEDAVHWLLKASEIKNNPKVKIRLALGYFYLKEYKDAKSLIDNLKQDSHLKKELDSNEQVLYNKLQGNLQGITF